MKMKFHFVIVLLTIAVVTPEIYSAHESVHLCPFGIDRIVPNNSIIVYRSTCTLNLVTLCCNTPVASELYVQVINNYIGEEGINICLLQPSNESFLFALYFSNPMPLSLTDYRLSLLQNDEALLYFRVINGPINSINCSFNDQEMQPVHFTQTVHSNNYSTLIKLYLPLIQGELLYNCSISSKNLVVSACSAGTELVYCVNSVTCFVETYLEVNLLQKTTAAFNWMTYTYCNRSCDYEARSYFESQTGFELIYEHPNSSTSSVPVSTCVASTTSSAQESLYAGIGALAFTNIITLIVLALCSLCLLNQRKKKRLNISEREQTVSLQNTSHTEGTSHNTETSPTSNNNTNITTGTNIYSSVEDEVDNHHHYHHRPPARVASQYEVPLDLLQQAHVPLPPPPPLYATLDDQHDLTLPNPEYITNTAVTAPNPGYITNIAAKPNPGYSATAIKEEGEGGERGEGERREELDYSYATVNKFLKKPTEDTEYNKLQHE